MISMGKSSGGSEATITRDQGNESRICYYRITTQFEKTLYNRIYTHIISRQEVWRFLLKPVQVLRMSHKYSSGGKVTPQLLLHRKYSCITLKRVGDGPVVEYAASNALVAGSRRLTAPVDFLI